MRIPFAPPGDRESLFPLAEMCGRPANLCAQASYLWFVTNWLHPAQESFPVIPVFSLTSYLVALVRKLSPGLFLRFTCFNVLSYMRRPAGRVISCSAHPEVPFGGPPNCCFFLHRSPVCPSPRFVPYGRPIRNAEHGLAALLRPSTTPIRSVSKSFVGTWSGP